MNFKLLFKSPKEEEEFWSEKITDPRIRAITLELGRYSKEHFNKELFVTCVGRTPSEQIEIYGEDTPSAHKFDLEKEELCRAVDIRTTIYGKDGKKIGDYYTQEEIAQLKSWFQLYFDEGWLYTFMVHDVGDGMHIHCQVASLKI